MARKYFGTDGIRGRANGVITPELALKVGQAAGAGVQARRAPPPRADRQGYAALRLHDRDRAGRGLHLGRHGCAADRPDADAGGRHAHAFDARRSRRDDLGLAQPLRRQRHQAVRARRLQAQRRHRAQDRSADGRRPRQEARQERRPRPRQAHRGRARPLHRVRQAHAAAHHESRRACASWSTAPTAPPIRWCRKPCGSSAPRSSRSASSPTASTSTATAARPRPRSSAARCARCAPISASRSTATPTA